MSLQSLMMQQQQQQPMVPEQGVEEEAMQAPAEQPTKPDGKGNATPEDQDAYDRVVVAGMKLLNDDKIREKIFALLEQGKGSPAKILGNATLNIMSILKEKSPKDIPESVVGSAAIEIMMMLAEEADMAGVFTVDERTLKQAAQVLLRGLATMYGVGPDEFNAAVQGGAQQPAAEPVAEEPPMQPEGQQAPMAQPGMLNRGRM